MTPLHLDSFDVAIASLLIVLNGVISIAYGLRIHGALAWSALRMVVQLLIVGMLLRYVFAASSAYVTLLVGAAMIAAAAREVATRPTRRLSGGRNYQISAIVVAVSSTAAVVLALLTAIRPTPWYDPRYAIALLGMVLGTVLNSATLSIDSFLEGVVASRNTIEARLSLGARFSEAIDDLARVSIRRGMIPVINQMSAAGIITLPGVMSGQLLAGMDPVEAAKYQILLLFLLTGASGIAALGGMYLTSRRLTDDRDRLRLDRLETRAPPSSHAK